MALQSDKKLNAAALADLPLAEHEPELVAIYISPGHSYWGKRGEGRMQFGVESPAEVEAVAGMGLWGDRYFSDKPQRHGQVTLFDEAVWLQIRERFRLPRLPGSVFRRNLMVRVPDMAALLGKRFHIQGVEFAGAQECRPCEWMDRAVARGTMKFMQENFGGGLRAHVLSTGTLTAPLPGADQPGSS